MNPVLKNHFFVSASDANAEGTLSITSLAAKIIEIATEHANLLGIGNPTMQHLNVGWVLSRLTIEMKQYPLVNSNFELKTWIEDFNRHFSARCFSIEDETRNILGYARSIWMLMDATNHTNYGLGHLQLAEGEILGENAPIERQEKHIPILPEGTEPSSTKKYLVATGRPYHYQFKYCDLDFYRHVNTVRYIAMLMNQFTLEEHDKFMVERLELSFLHEASFGMETTLLRSNDDTSSLRSSFQLSETVTNKPLLFARVHRKERL